MTPVRFRSILAATDLRTGSDAIVGAAAALAARLDAELHLVHALEVTEPPPGVTPEPYDTLEKTRDAEAALERQYRRVAVPGQELGSSEVVTTLPFKAILDRAAIVSADLIVVGAHRRGPVHARFVGSTADRVARSCDVPCLIVRDPLVLPIERIGVPLDLSDISLGALKLGIEMGAVLGPGGDDGDGRVEVRALFVDTPPTPLDGVYVDDDTIRREVEAKVSDATAKLGRAAPVAIDLRRDRRADDGILEWIETIDAGLVVMATHGRTGLKRALIGSVASAVAHEANRPVLLLPPALWDGGEGRPSGDDRPIDAARIVVAVDLSQSAKEAAEWTAEVFAPGAKLTLVHALKVPAPPAPFGGRFPPHADMIRLARAGAEVALAGLAVKTEGRVRVEEGDATERILAAARETDADLIVVGEHTHSRGIWDVLGTTAERILHQARLPVLVVRDPPRHRPRVILAAVDESTTANRVLRWIRFLADRYEAAVVAIHAIELWDADFPTVWSSPASAPLWDEARLIVEYERHLASQLEAAGLRGARVEGRVTIGAPSAEILAAAAAANAELVVMGSHGAGAVERVLLGTVTSEVVRGARCPVLVIPTRAG